MSSTSNIANTGAPLMDEFIERVVAEYYRSRNKWPIFRDYDHGASVMVEEVLELIKDMNEGCPDLENSRSESVQACAMIMAIFLELL